jgi:hypothetical protein
MIGSSDDMLERRGECVFKIEESVRKRRKRMWIMMREKKVE